MADNAGNNALMRKRLKLMLSEQKIMLERQELRLCEIEDEKQKLSEAMAITQEKITELEKQILAEGA